MKEKRGIWIILFLLALPLVFADVNETAQYQEMLDTAEERLRVLDELNFSTQRYNDTLFLANQLFNIQLGAIARNETPDFSAAAQRIQELTAIEELAYTARDELVALDLAIQDLDVQNFTRILDAYAETERAFYAERYEEALDLVENTYQVISEVEATETRVRALYAATTRTLGNFIRQHWLELIIIIGVLVIVSILACPPIKSLRIRRRIRALQVREQAIDGLIAKTQKEYFDRGSISEAAYGIRMKKYKELIRDIHRIIPLEREAFVMVQQSSFNLFKIKLEKGETNEKDNKKGKGEKAPKGKKPTRKKTKNSKA